MIYSNGSTKLFLPLNSPGFLLGRWDGGGRGWGGEGERFGEVLARAAKRKALCNLGHCKEQL